MALNAASLIRLTWIAAYRVTLALLWPVTVLLCALRRRAVHEDSVLHISYMVHIPYHTTRILRRHGVRADYMAIGTSPTWDKSDFRRTTSAVPVIQALREFLLFWRVVARYEVIHSHFALTMSVCGWELPLLRRMGRKLVIHYRGCEIRDARENKKLHPDLNICEECDYAAVACASEQVLRRRALAEKYGDAFLVTTPDLKDFAPEAEHMPFFAPENLPEAAPRPEEKAGGLREVRIVHATNHPGIEGTARIRKAIERLETKGHSLCFEFLTGVAHDTVLKALAEADLSIGKMKMGYYANAQIESMCLGVSAITYVRPEFMTDELRDSGFIFATLEELEQTLEHYLQHPQKLEAKRRIARESVLRLHDNDALAKQYIALYNGLREKS